MRVIAMPEVFDYIETLMEILYQKEYFGFRESAQGYAIDLLDDIRATLPTRPHKIAPEYFNRYEKNMYYATFKKNKQTTWYAFFTIYNQNGDTVYLVHYIANNHTVAQHL